MSSVHRVPDTVFKTRVRNDALGGSNPYEWKDRTTQELFGGKKVVVFSLPSTFTPTCSTSHLPRYEELLQTTSRNWGSTPSSACRSTTPSVMFQWGKAQGVKNVFLLPDGNGELSRKMGMLVDKSNLGFGMRSWRYSMYVDDGNIEKMFIEPGYSDLCSTDPFEVSDADTMLNYLKGRKA